MSSKNRFLLKTSMTAFKRKKKSERDKEQKNKTNNRLNGQKSLIHSYVNAFVQYNCGKWQYLFYYDHIPWLTKCESKKR